MPRFEGLIRPLLGVNVSPPRRVIAAGEQDVPNVIFSIGGSGSPKTFSISGSSSINGYMEKQQKEITEPTAAVEV
jgi:hypothetical protein